MEAIQQPLSNVQLEILKAFSHNLSEPELQELRAMLAAFFAKRAIEAANKVWEEKGWSDADVDEMLEQKMRASKN